MTGIDFHTITHIDDNIKMVGENMSFGEYKTTNEYRLRLSSVLREIKGGQHLRFVGTIYRTPEVCMIAVKNSPEYDAYSVPEKYLESVLNTIVREGVSCWWWQSLPEEFKTDALKELYKTNTPY